jgi:hypothetical protein
MPERRSVVIACAFLMLGVGVSAGAQSLADVARKEEARRKAISKPAKVYTNNDLKPVPPPPPSASSSAEAKPDGKAASDKDAADKSSADKTATAKGTEPADASTKTAAAPDQAKDQTYWASRLQALKDQLDRDQTYADALQSRINALTTDFINRDDPAQKSVLERDRLKALAELDRLKKAIPDDKKAIDNLLEEARRASVPPGWLR